MILECYSITRELLSDAYGKETLRVFVHNVGVMVLKVSEEEMGMGVIKSNSARPS